MAAGSDNEKSEEWQFSLEDLDEDTEPVEADDSEESDDGSIAGTLAANQPLEPGEIDLENAVFVLLGALLVVGLIAATLFGL